MERDGFTMSIEQRLKGRYEAFVSHQPPSMILPKL